MTFKNQVSVWLALEIFLEVGGKSTQRLLLTSNQATRRLCRRRLRSRKVNAVQGEPGFELPDFRRDLWRWWSLYGYCGRRRGAQTALVAASCVHRDCTRRSASRVQRRSTSAAREVAAGRGEIADGDRNIVRTCARARNRNGCARLHARRITRARNCWRILGRLFDCEVGGGAGISILLRLRINDVHGGGATAARNAVGINTGGGVVAGNLSAGAAPVIGQGVFRIEVAGSRGRRNRLTHHHFRRLNSKRCGRDSGFRISEIEHEPGAQPHTLQSGSCQV